MSSMLSPWANSYFGQDPDEDLYTCSECMAEEIDPDYTTKHTVNDKDVCHDCITSCPLCGEYIDDDQRLKMGPPVRYREWAANGKLTEPTCAMCAAIDILCLWADDLMFDVLDASKDEIDAVVLAAGPWEKLV